MNQKLFALAEDIASASKLSLREQNDLKRELISDFAERERDLMLSENNNDVVIDQITQTFGSSKKLGKEFFYAHQPLARIPIIGDLFYYKPLWYAMLVVVSEVFAYLFTFFAVTFIIQNLLGGLIDPEEPYTIYLLIEIGLYILFIMLRGWWLYRRLGGVAGIIEVYNVLYVPLIVLAGVVFVRFNLDFSQPQPVPYLFAIAYLTLNLGIALIAPIIDVLFRRFTRREQ